MNFATTIGGLLGILIYALFAAVFFYVLFVVVRAAVLSALRKHTEEERASIAPLGQDPSSDD